MSGAARHRGESRGLVEIRCVFLTRDPGLRRNDG
jgi:hypothetical protein